MAIVAGDERPRVLDKHLRKNYPSKRTHSRRREAMIKVEIDPEVFEVLKRQAEPFVDKPNDVIRRLLGLNSSPTIETRQTSPQRESSNRSHTDRGGSDNSLSFSQRVLESQFEESFQLRRPYRTMYESPKHLVYFQNFSRVDASHLWYRLRGKALEVLLNTGQESFVVFANPAEGSGYLIPTREIRHRADRLDWTRDDLEVNIDPTRHYWRELDWDLSLYFHQFLQPAVD